MDFGRFMVGVFSGFRLHEIGNKAFKFENDWHRFGEMVLHICIYFSRGFGRFCLGWMCIKFDCVFFSDFGATWWSKTGSCSVLFLSFEIALEPA